MADKEESVFDGVAVSHDSEAEEHKDKVITTANYERIKQSQIDTAVQPIRDYDMQAVINDEYDGVFSNLDPAAEKLKDDKKAEDIIQASLQPKRRRGGKVIEGNRLTHFTNLTVNEHHSQREFFEGLF